MTWEQENWRERIKKPQIPRLRHTIYCQVLYLNHQTSQIGTSRHIFHRLCLFISARFFIKIKDNNTIFRYYTVATDKSLCLNNVGAHM